MNSNPNKTQNSRRNLKVELAGDVFHRKTFPKIRLQGKWLQELGFMPSGRVEIIPITEGELILRFLEGTEPSSPHHLNEKPGKYWHNPS